MAPIDRGASWLMHSSKHVDYTRDTPYYHDVTQLPPGSVSSAGDNGSEGNLSSSTLAMRTPGPKKFHQLVNFVQRRLIEKEKLRLEDQQRPSQQDVNATPPKMRLRNPHAGDEKHDHNDGTNTSRTRALAKVIEDKSTPQNETDGKIRKMARNLEGDQTPTMRLKEDEELFGSGKAEEGRSRRRSRYIPRMRLREIKDASDDQAIPNPLDEETRTPRMKLIQGFQDVATSKANTSEDFSQPHELKTALQAYPSQSETRLISPTTNSISASTRLDLSTDGVNTEKREASYSITTPMTLDRELRGWEEKKEFRSQRSRALDHIPSTGKAA